MDLHPIRWAATELHTQCRSRQKSFKKAENTDIKETSNDPLENLSQPEVESLMPKVFTN